LHIEGKKFMKGKLQKLSKVITVFGITLFALAAGVPYANAAITPILTLSNYQNNNSTVQISVNADAYAQVNLYSNGSFMGSIGYTDNNGNLYTTLNGGYYSIPANSYLYVVVDGVASPTVSWPYNNGYNNYAPYPTNYYPQYQYPSYQATTLSQNTLYLNAGQSSSVSIYGGGNYYVSNNSNSSVASGSINGNILNIYAYNGGSANISVCGSFGSCASVFVNVANAYVPPPVYIPSYYPPQPIVNYPPPIIVQYSQPQPRYVRPYSNFQFAPITPRGPQWGYSRMQFHR
jgi:hypothetical protein